MNVKKRITPFDIGYKIAEIRFREIISDLEKRLEEKDMEKIKIVNSKQICKKFILAPSHYNPDGTCRCNDITHREMNDWGYVWHKKEKKWVRNPNNNE